MLPADLDDEQRAHFAHEHPTDLDSGSSSPSSAVHTSTSTFYNSSRRRSKSASHNRSNTSADGSPSSHLLARLVASEEEVREINAALVVTSERLEAESSRANAAERRALDYFHRLRIATENRERAEQDSARLREELKLYKLQLENAQKEIFRAQDIIDQVAAQRNEAEAEAARARTKARKLQEEKLVMFAREEGRRMGYREGLSMGRRIGYDEGSGRRLTGPSDPFPHYPVPLENLDGDDNVEDLTDDERNDPPARVQLRSSASIRQPPMRSESAPPVRTFETALHAPLPIPSHINPDRSQTPSHENRTASSHGSDEPETIRPIPIRASPILPAHHINPPAEVRISRPNSRTSHRPVPPPHGPQQPVPSSPSSVATDIQDDRPTREPEPTPIPPPIRSRDYAYQPSVPVPIQHPRTASTTSRTSTHLSQYDLVNKRPGSSLRNEIYLGRAGSGSQPSRPSTRNEHRDDERRHSSRTEAEFLVEQWRADSDTATPPRNPPRSFTPSSASHPRRPPNFYYRPREIVTPTPLGDVGEDPVPTESTATQPHPPPSEDTGSQTAARLRSPLEYIRQRFRQRPSSSSTGVPDIVVEPPSEPETSQSPSATHTAQPELLSPDAANRPLPQDDSQSQPPSQPPSHYHHHHSHHHHPPPPYDRAGTPATPWPAGFIPYTPVQGSDRDHDRDRDRDRDRERERDRDHDRDRDRRRYPDPPTHHRTTSNPTRPQSHSHSQSSQLSGRSYTPSPTPTYTTQAFMYTAPALNVNALPSGYARTRTQSASSSLGGRSVAAGMAGTVRGAAAGGTGAYEAAPLPPGVMYPAPPPRPQTSHRRHRERDRERDREWEGDRERGERQRDHRDRDRDRERDRDRRREPGRDYERDRQRREMEHDADDDTGLDDESAPSPAPLQRPISLFDSDEA